MNEQVDYVNVLWSPQFDKYIGNWLIKGSVGVGGLAGDLDTTVRRIVDVATLYGDGVEELFLKSVLPDRFTSDKSVTQDDFDLILMYLNDPEYNPSGIKFLTR